MGTFFICLTIVASAGWIVNGLATATELIRRDLRKHQHGEL